MELQEIMQSFLPREVIEVFDIQKIEDGAAKEQLDIYLDERRVVPAHLQGLPIVAYGFVEAVTIQDFPIRGKRVFLHLRRRKWLDKSTDRIH
ncbi:MAG: transposase family protein, partial [Alistipes sp.]